MLSNIEYIGKSTFDNCICLENIVFDLLPDHMICIDDKAFAYCNALADIEFSDNVLFGKDVFIGTELEADYSDRYNSFEKVPLNDASSSNTDDILDDMEIVPMIILDENEVKNTLYLLKKYYTRKEI